MASYLSYFTSGTAISNPLQYQTAPGAGAGSTWSSTFSSRIATLRKALTKDSEEDDPDNEDCSHVSNVLRAYYTEKGRTFPEWLPPDPKRPVAPVPQMQSQYNQQYGNPYGNQYGSQPAHGRGGSGGRGGLSDLWDSSPAPMVAPQAQSLRAPRPSPQSLRSHDSAVSQSSDPGLGSQLSPRGTGARPLPSQRAGSYQNAPGANPAPSAMGSKDRLRARLQGGGSGRSSPAPTSSGGQVSYGPSGGGYNSQGGGGSPYMAASEPWSSSGNTYGYDSGYNQPPANNPYGNPSQRQRPGGPR